MSEQYPPPAAPPGGPSGPRASFWSRLAAVIIDGILVSIPYFLLLILGANLALAYLVSLVVGVGYYVYLEGGERGQTLGKRALGIRVIDFGGGGPIGYGRALLRYVGRIVSSIPCALGYLWMLWDREKQTWHDKIATTVVVPVSDYPVP